jgi:hypothetical protein
MLQGEPPYKEVYNMKLPGTYAAYALIMAVFGQTASGIHVGLMLVNLASIVLMFLIGRRLLDDTTGIVATIIFALMSLSPSVLGLAGHATQFVVLPALGGILLLIKKIQNAQLKPENSKFKELGFFMAGLLFGIALLMKQHGVFFGIFGGMYLGWLKVQSRFRIGISKTRSSKFGEKRENPLITIGSLASYSAGFVIPYALTCLALWWAGVFQNFYFWTVSYAGKYASAIPVENRGLLLKNVLGTVIGPNVVLWLLPWAGLALLWCGGTLLEKVPGKRKRDWPQVTIPAPHFFFTGLLLASLASVSVGFNFREHYFVTLLPIVGLLSGIAVSWGWHLAKCGRSTNLVRTAPGAGMVATALGVAIFALFGIGTAAAVNGDGFDWFATPRRAYWEIYKTSIFAESEKLGEFIKTHTPPKARIAVVGSEPEIYFHADRHSATGYIYTYPLVEMQPYAKKMQEEMIGEIERTRPEYVVYVHDKLSWLGHRGSPTTIFDWWDKYWAANLEVVNTVKIEQMGDQPGTDPDRYLLLLKRKDG